MTNKLILIIFSAVVLVVVGGILAWQFWPSVSSPSPNSSPVIPTPSSTPTSTPPPLPSSSPDETAEWGVYTNEKYGFKIKYPKKYYNSQKSTDDKIFFDWSSGNNCIGISDLYIEFNEEKDENCNISEILIPTSNQKAINELSEKLINRGWPKNIEINNLKFYRRYSAEHTAGGKEWRKYTYKIPYNNSCYNIILNLRIVNAFGFTDECMDVPSVDFDAGLMWEKILRPILSTFKFTD